MKEIGILDLGANVNPRGWRDWQAVPEMKQYVAVTPQVISVWCRQLGHRVHYASYYGFGDPMKKLPAQLDVVMIAAHTHVAPLAYALSKMYRKRGIYTVLGGPHAKAFPRNAAIHFDCVVLECDKTLIADILNGRVEPHSVVSSPKPYDDTPTIQERLPELEASVFLNKRPYAYTLIPMLSSIGCPYSCNFCAGWKHIWHSE